MPASLYCITNTITGKQYFGVSLSPFKRMSRHLRGHKGCSLMVARSVSKYGINNHSQNIILEGSEEYCYDMERKIIGLYQSQVPNGMNIAPGGENPPSKKVGFKKSEETKAKQRATIAKNGREPTRLGAITSEDTKRKISEAKKGMPGPKQSKETIAKRVEKLKGHATSEETRCKISNALTGRKLTEEHKSKLSAAKKGKTPWNKGIKKGNK